MGWEKLNVCTLVAGDATREQDGVLFGVEGDERHYPLCPVKRQRVVWQPLSVAMDPLDDATLKHGGLQCPHPPAADTMHEHEGFCAHAFSTVTEPGVGELARSGAGGLATVAHASRQLADDADIQFVV